MLVAVLGGPNRPGPPVAPQPRPAPPGAGGAGRCLWPRRSPVVAGDGLRRRLARRCRVAPPICHGWPAWQARCYSARDHDISTPALIINRRWRRVVNSPSLLSLLWLTLATARRLVRSVDPRLTSSPARAAARGQLVRVVRSGPWSPVRMPAARCGRGGPAQPACLVAHLHLQRQYRQAALRHPGTQPPAKTGDQPSSPREHRWTAFVASVAGADGADHLWYAGKYLPALQRPSPDQRRWLVIQRRTLIDDLFQFNAIILLLQGFVAF